MTRALHADGVLCCEVGNERYAFRSADVRHVERAEYLRVERGEDRRLGTLKLGGQQVPVFALSEVLGRSALDDHAGVRGSHIAITADRNTLTGWLVDRVERTTTPAPGDIAPLPSIIGTQASAWFEGIVWLVGDIAALLLAPHRLMSRTSAVEITHHDAAFVPLQPGAMAPPEPVAVIFSTSVLPRSAACRYALSGRQVAAIVQPTASIAVPGCHDYVDGITRWHRAVVPRIDFRPPGARTSHRRQLIAQCGARRLGSLVALSIDSEVTMCHPGDEHHAMPDVPCPAFASGMFSVSGETVALLDLDALLAIPSES
jgi:chemotaxis signal transduction protein